MTRKPDLATVYAMMSDDSLLDFAETGKPHQRAVAKRELRQRVRFGRVDNMDFDRAAVVLDLA